METDKERVDRLIKRVDEMWSEFEKIRLTVEFWNMDFDMIIRELKRLNNK